MAKDPAFLFYSSDFLTGTMFMNNEQVGIYIRLLCAQHQHGGIIDKISFNSLVGDNLLIRNKFIETESGFYNDRLKNECDKRSEFCKSRNNNKKGHNQYKSGHMTYTRPKDGGHMENENENVNVIKDKIKNKAVFKKPTIEEVRFYCESIGSSVDGEYFWHHYEQTNWIKPNGQKVINWKSTIKTWEKRQTKKEDGLKIPKAL